MDLAQQTSTARTVSPGPSSLAAISKAVVIVAVIGAAILVGSLLRGSFAGSGGDARQLGDTSYDQVEALRGAIVLSGNASDTSYDQVERIRALPRGD